MIEKHHKKDFDKDAENTSGNLDEYIRVSKPGTRVVLAALLVVLAAVIAWGFIGKLPVKETVKGLVIGTRLAKSIYSAEGGLIGEDDPAWVTGVVEQNDYALKDALDENNIDPGETYIYCFVDASRFSVTQVEEFGDEAILEMPDHNRFTGKIRVNIKVPLSTQECRAVLFENDWVTEHCVKTDYSWWLIIEPDQDISQYEFMLTDVTIVTEEVAPISFLAG